MNISRSELSRIDSKFDVLFFDEEINSVEPQKAVNIYVSADKVEGVWVGKTIKAPKNKAVTLEWLSEKLVSEKIFVNFSKTFNSFLKTLNCSGYATSYGIGIEALFVKKDELSKAQEDIAAELKKAGIVFTTEFSSAHWVYRYKISKSKANIDNIKKYISR